MKNFPKDVNEQEFISIVQKIAKKLSSRYVFASYEAADIEQEAFIIAMEAMSRYDTSKPLENFLYVHINNRLKNFKRDNYYRFEVGAAQRIQDSKRNILEPIDIHGLYNVATGDTISNDVHLLEILKLIDEKLPSDMRGDYLRLKNNGKLTKNRKLKIIQTIHEILSGEDLYEEG